jgi:hypothetical protein
MATGPITQLADVVVPTIFADYIRTQTEVKSRLVQSGAIVRAPLLDTFLAGGGASFNIPSWNDIDDDAERIATDVASARFAGTTQNPYKLESKTEVAVRLNRAHSIQAANLAAVRAGSDPMAVAGDRIAAYWTRRLQDAFISHWVGVLADNGAPSGTGVADDLTNDVSAAGVFTDGVTNFSAEAFLDAKLTMGDSMDDLGLVMMHSVVYNRAQKNNLIDFIPDSEGRVSIPTFMGAEVIVDDSMPNAANVYDTWMFGTGATLLGVGNPPSAIEFDRDPDAGNGFGADILYTRVDWMMHPVGHAYDGAVTGGGPTNTTLEAAASWSRVYPERKQIKFARLLTTEA